MAFDVNAALKVGYSPSEIADYLGTEKKFNVAVARESGYSDEEIINYLNPKKQEGVSGSFKKGVEQLISTGRTALESVTGSPEEAALAAQKRQADIESRYGEGASLERLKQAYADKGILAAGKELASQIPTAIAEQVPNIGSTIASGLAGAAAGSVVPGVGTVLGGIAGVAAPTLIQSYGGNIQRQAQAQQEKGQELNIDRSKAAAYAVPMAALDVASTFIPLGGKVAGKVFGPAVERLLTAGDGAAAEKLARETFLPSIKQLGLGTAVKGTATGVASQIPTEIGQQMLERANAGLALTDDDALREYGETAFDVSLLGPLGILGRVSNKADARQKVLAAQRKAQETGEPQQIELEVAQEPKALGYDPNVQAPTTYGLTPIIVNPDGSTSFPSEANQFAQQPVSELSDQGLRQALAPQAATPTAPGATQITEAFADPADQARINEARWAEARANSPTMQKFLQHKEVVTKEQQARRQQATEAFQAGELQGGVYMPPSPKEPALSPTQTIAYMDPVDGIRFYEGTPNKTGSGVNFIDKDGKSKTISSTDKNAVINPNELDIYSLETQALAKTLPSLRKARDEARVKYNKDNAAFKKFLQEHPLRSMHYSDYIRPGTNPNALLSAGQTKNMFINSKVNGYNPDDLADIAHKAGFLSDEEFNNPEDNGGVNAFMDKFTQAYEGIPVETPNTFESKATYEALDNEYMARDEEIQKRNVVLENKKSAVPTEEQIVPAEFVPNEPATPADMVTPAEYAYLEPVNPSFRAEVATPYTDKFLADQDKLIDGIRKSLDKMGLKDVSLKIADSLQRRVDGKMEDINGAYFDKMILLSLAGDNINRTMTHEALHAMKDLGFFSPRDWKMLEFKAQSLWMKKYDIVSKYGNETPEIQIEEAIAHAFADMSAQPGAIKAIMSKAINILKRIGNFLRGQGYRTADDIFGEAKAGELKPTKEGKGDFRALVNTATGAFKKWFGDSKIVNEDGSPKVMYHGTLDDVTAFRSKTANAIFVTDNPKFADRFANNFVGREDGQPNIIPLYVKSEKPFDYDNPSDIKKVLREIAKTDPELYEKFEQEFAYYEKVKKQTGKMLNNWSLIERPELQDAIKKLEFDSFYVDEDGFKSLAVYSPTQLKSATGNKGTFDITNPDIRAEVPSKAKLKSALSNVDKEYADKIIQQFTQEKATVEQKFNNLKKGFFDRMMTGIFDEFRAIKKYDEKSYMQARLSKSIDGALQGLLEHGQVVNDGGALNIVKNTKGLLQILEPVGSEVDQYQIWKALNRDARMPEDKRSFSNELVVDRDKLIQGDLNGKPRKAIYEKALKEENDLNRSVLKVALDAGIIDQEGFNNFANDIYYIPFYKQMEGGDVQSVSNAAKLTGQYFSKALKGGDKKTNDLMENVLMNWSHILSASMKNQAAVSTVKAAVSMDAAERVKPMDGKYPPGSVKVMEAGKPVHYLLTDPDLVDAISTISYLGPKSAFLDVARGFTNALRYGITLSPAYKVRNLVRDSIQSAAISELGNNVLNNVYTGLKMGTKDNPTFMSALVGGGIFEMGTAHEGNQSKMIKRLIDKGVNANQILDTPEKIKANLQGLLEKYNELGNKFENANRLALYQKLIDSGKSHLEASYAARDLMDFSMQGQFRAVKILGSVVPFFNARLQGLYKLGRDGITPTYRVICNATTGAPLEINDKKKAQRFMTISGSVMMASVLLYGMYKDDEDFKRREDWDRDNFWWFKIGDTQFRIPKPFEIGALGTIAERTYEQIADDSVEGKVFSGRINSMLADTFSLNPTPQMVKPLIDLYANKDSFTGAPIESGGMENLSKQERINSNTSGLAIALGGISEIAAKILTFNPQAQGVSPIQMDYAIKAYLGWLGATAASTADLAVEPFTEGTRVRKPVIDTVGLGFIKTEPQTQSKYMTQFYTNNARIQSAMADMRHYAQLGDMEKVQKIYESKGDDIMVAKMYDQASKQFAELRKQSRLIQEDKNMGTEDKRTELNRIKILMSDMAKQIEDMRKSLQK
jgi:hypothetical protein